MKTSKSDFTFIKSGNGHYQVTYQSPITNKKWWKITDNMPLIDAIKNEDKPKRKDLEILKFICKQIER